MKPMTKWLTCALAISTLAACGVTPNTGNVDERQLLNTQCLNAISQFKNRDASLQAKLDSARAYAVFPEVVNAAIGVGGAHGNGEVFKNGTLIGYADMSQGNIGIQLGAQKYSELILFENDRALEDFQASTVEFDARTTAVAADSGAAGSADYTRGVLVFSLPQSGLMLQAAIGGQKFRYTPASDVAH